MNTGLVAAADAVRLYKRILEEERIVDGRLLAADLNRRSAAMDAAVRALREQGRAGQRVAHLCADLTRTANEVQQLAKDVTAPFTLFVVGMGNYGKSTLLNALLGQSLAEMDVLPKTWKVDIFSADVPENQAEIRHGDGSVRRVDLAAAHQIVAAEEAKVEAGEDAAEREFRKRRAGLDPVQSRELRQRLYEDFAYRSPIVEVRWPCPETPFSRQFDLVDTPGLFQRNAAGIEQTLKEHYHRADGVLWLLDATAIAAGQTKKLRAEMDEWLDAVGGRVENMIGVLNRIDLVRTADDPEAKAVRQAAAEIYGGEFKEIVAVSARDALQAALERDRVLTESSGLSALRDAIDRHFARRAAYLRRHSKQQGLALLHKTASDRCREAQAQLQADLKQRDDVSGQYQAELAAIAQTLNQELEQAVAEHTDRVEALIETQAEAVFSHQRYWRAEFILEKILAAGALAQIVTQHGERLAAELRRIAGAYKDPCTFTQYRSLLGVESLADLVGPPIEIRLDAFAVATGLMEKQELIRVGGEALQEALGDGLVGSIVRGIREGMIRRRAEKLKAELRELAAALAAKARQEYEEQAAALVAQLRERLAEIQIVTFAELNCPLDEAPRTIAGVEGVSAHLAGPLQRARCKDVLTGRVAYAGA